MNTTLQIRIDSKDKMEAQKIFKKMGMDLSSGIKTFVKQVITDKAMPFQARTVNGFTPEYEKKIIRETEWAEKHGKRYSSYEEMMKDIVK